jgi:uncharacterized protein
MELPILESDTWDSPRLCLGDDGRTHLIVVQPSSFCNIDCRYCYVPERGDRTRISLDILEQIIRKTLSSKRVANDVRWVWHNGEPLTLGVDFYRSAIQLIEQHNSAGRAIRHRVQTNATLIDQQWIEFFVEYGITPCVSIDGPKDIHDANRVTRSNNGTFDDVMRGVESLRCSGIPLVALCVVTSSSLPNGARIMRFFIEQGFENVGFIMEEPTGGDPATSIDGFGIDWQVLYRQFYDDVIREWYPYRDEISIREFDDMLSALSRMKKNDSAITQQEDSIPGRVVSFDRAGSFSTFSPQMIAGVAGDKGKFIVGHISEIDCLDDIGALPRHIAIAEKVMSGVEACRNECAYFSLCGGGTPAGKVYETGRFDVTETRQCIGSRQILADVMISCLQKYQQSVDLQVKKIREVRSDSVKAFMMEVASEQFEAAHARRLGDKIFIWNVPRLWEKAKELTPKSVKISDLPEVDRNCWFGGRRDASISRVAAHMRRALSADLRYPIILNSDATLMDGGHRLCNAILNDNCEIAAVRFPRMPSPDAIVDVPEHLLNRT